MNPHNLSDVLSRVANAIRDQEDPPPLHELPISQQLKYARRGQMLTQQEVAQRMGVTQAYVSYLEKADDLPIKQAQAYAHALGQHIEVEVRFVPL